MPYFISPRVEVYNVLMLMWDEDAQHFTNKPGPEQNAKGTFRQVQVTNAHGEGGD